MSRLIPACSFAAACIFAVSVSAQDTTVKSKTKIEADDAKIITMTGCLSKTPSGDVFVLAGATKLAGDEMTARSKTKVDVDDDETETKTKSKTEVEHDDDKAVGTSGSVAVYELMPKEGVDLTPHVGHKVEVSAIALDPKDHDDDAEVEIQTRTKVKRDDAPDSKVKTETEAELPRGENARLTVVSVKHIAPSCTQ
jgi:glycerol-3-phosphate cytidylyltransferase-like family protein